MARGANKWDVELVRARTRGRALMTVTSRASYALCIAATALPIWMMQGVIKPLAGKTTEIVANVPITLIMSASIFINLTQGIAHLIRKRSFKELRHEKDILEAKLGLEARVELEAEVEV